MVSQLVVGKNTYGTLTDADTYHDDSPNGAGWALLGVDDKKRALIEATRQLERCVYDGTAVGGNIVDTIAVNAGGTGYVVGEIITGTTGTGLPFRATVATLSGSAVATLTLLDAGNYTVDPTTTAEATTASASGTGCTVDLTLTAQVLLFLRSGLTGVDGESLPADEYPALLTSAEFALALAIAEDPTLATSTSTGSNDKRYKAGSVELERFRPEKGSRFPEHVTEMLFPLLGGNSRLSPYSNTSGAESSFDGDSAYGLTQGFS